LWLVRREKEKFTNDGNIWKGLIKIKGSGKRLPIGGLEKKKS